MTLDLYVVALFLKISDLYAWNSMKLDMSTCFQLLRFFFFFFYMLTWQKSSRYVRNGIPNCHQFTLNYFLHFLYVCFSRDKTISTFLYAIFANVNFSRNYFKGGSKIYSTRPHKLGNNSPLLVKYSRVCINDLNHEQNHTLLVTTSTSTK